MMDTRQEQAMLQTWIARARAVEVRRDELQAERSDAWAELRNTTRDMLGGVAYKHADAETQAAVDAIARRHNARADAHHEREKRRTLWLRRAKRRIGRRIGRYDERYDNRFVELALDSLARAVPVLHLLGDVKQIEAKLRAADDSAAAVEPGDYIYDTSVPGGRLKLVTRTSEKTVWTVPERNPQAGEIERRRSTLRKRPHLRRVGPELGLIACQLAAAWREAQGKQAAAC